MSWHARQPAAALPPDDSNGVTPRRVGRPPAFLPNDFESVLPAQWFAGTAGPFQPEKRLMLAALSDAIDLFLQAPAPTNARRTMLQRTATDWIRANDRQWLFSFVNICETLGLQPRRLRERFERLSEQRRTRTSTVDEPLTARREG